MPRPGKRRLEDFDPNQSDPDDLDFNNEAPSSPQRRRPSKKQKSSQHRTPQKKRPRRQYASDSDIVDDEDDISEKEFTESSEEEEVEVNPSTGRAVRRATKKEITYEESDADEEKDFVEDTAESDNGRDELAISPKKTRNNITSTNTNTRLKFLKPSRIIKIKFNNWDVIGVSSSSHPSPMPEVKPIRARSTRSRTASRPPTALTPMAGTRKSSRLSREPEPMVALSNSGRHAIPASNSGSPEDDDDEITTRNRTRGSKGPQIGNKQPRKMPSTVMEESQSHTEDMAENDGDAEEQLPIDVVDSVELHVEGAEEAEEEQDEQPVESEVAGPATDEAGGQPVPDQSDESDGPVGPRRALRVSATAFYRTACSVC